MATMSFINGRVVTAGEVANESIRIDDGVIVAVGGATRPNDTIVDLEGDYLLPGFVELHTDNLEKHFAPRPGVSWPAIPAVIAHDAQIAAGGITTVFDALCVGDLHQNSARIRYFEDMFEAIGVARLRLLLRADHHIHLRCEVSHPCVVDSFQDHADDPEVGLVSLMDHTPGQRQFTDLDAYKRYYGGKYGMTEDALARFMEEKREAQERYSARHRARIAAECRSRGIKLASHDDATEAHVVEAIDDGVAISEFPTTVEAARLAHDSGLGVLMGAPNLVLGGSHSGNVSAVTLAEEGLLDILSSDYVPASLVQGVFDLHLGPARMALPEAVKRAAGNPARMAGLDDRGDIRVGKRADLVRVAVHDGHALVVNAWREGGRIV